MNLGEALRLAGGSLKNNKLRSALTLLGVIIGIAAVIAILTLGKALQSQTLGAIEGSGASDLMVQVMPRETDENGEETDEGVGDASAAYGMGGNVDDEYKITPEDVEEIKSVYGNRIVGIALGDNGGMWGALTRLDDSDLPIGKPAQASVDGINVDGLNMQGEKIAYGKGFDQDDVDSGAHVAVVSYGIVENLFDGKPLSALGQTVEFAQEDGVSAEFTIIGVQEKAKSGLLSFGDYKVMVPYTVTASLQEKPVHYTSVSIRPKPDEDRDVFAKQLQGFLDSKWTAETGTKAKVNDFSQAIEGFTKVLGAISMVISAIAGISLLVGGIGIMNIMLVTVTERTREIGIRKALGATKMAIRLQFVIEAMLVCLLGGIIGIVLGGAAGMVGGKMMGHFVWPPISGVLIALLFSLATGVFFGFYPANKAAKMNPIEALRHE